MPIPAVALIAHPAFCPPALLELVAALNAQLDGGHTRLRLVSWPQAEPWDAAVVAGHGPWALFADAADSAAQQLWLERGALEVLSSDQPQPLMLARLLRLVRQLGASQERTHDRLTGLANRQTLLAELGQRLQGAAAEPLAVLFIDLLHFKQFNDDFGHAAGDELLRQLARLLQGQLPAAAARLYRYGGDEFVVVLSGPAELEFAACQLAVRLATLLEQPLPCAGRQVRLGASIGIALAPAHGHNADQLLQHAVMAMAEARSGSGGNIIVFAPAMAAAQALQQQLELNLAAAIGSSQFELHFQPVVELGSGRVRAVEALLRWQHPQWGTLSPTAFMALAERSGLAEPLGRQVIELACQQAQLWQQQGINLPIALNLSPLQLAAADFAEHLLGCCRRYRLELKCFHFEISEARLLANFEEKLALLQGLQRQGAQIVLDDYGDGFSSLLNLTRLPANIIKIDRRFIATMLDHEPHRLVVTAVVQLARALGKTALAEGVENDEQRTLLMMLGCDLGQGFLFAHPLAAAEFSDWYTEIQAEGGLAGSWLESAVPIAQG